MIREQLGGWLHAHLKTSLTGEAVADGPLQLARSLEHLAALLGADDDQRLWLPLANSALYGFADRLEELGRLGLVTRALDAVEAWIQRFPKTKAAEPKWLHETTVLRIDQGDVRLAQGDLSGALESYGEALKVSRRLADADSSNAGWQRDLSVSLTKMSQCHEQQGERSRHDVDASVRTWEWKRGILLDERRSV